MNFAVMINALASGLNLYTYYIKGSTLSLTLFFICGIFAVMNWRGSER